MPTVSDQSNPAQKAQHSPDADYQRREDQAVVGER